MKNIIKTIIILMILIIINQGLVFASNSIGVVLNGSSIQFNDSSGYPFIDSNNRTLVPLRKTMEAAGYSVSWNVEKQEASVYENSGTSVYIKIGENFITKELTKNGIKESSRFTK